MNIIQRAILSAGALLLVLTFVFVPWKRSGVLILIPAHQETRTNSFGGTENNMIYSKMGTITEYSYGFITQTNIDYYRNEESDPARNAKIVWAIDFTLLGFEWLAILFLTGVSFLISKSYTAKSN